MKKTPATLRADAAHMRKLAADMLVKAEQCELDAQRMEEEREAREEANKMLVEMFFAYRRQLRTAH